VAKILPSVFEARSQSRCLSLQEQTDFYGFVFEPSDNHYNKFQLLAAALGKKVSCYSLQREQLSLECVLCDRTVSLPANPDSKKTVKKDLAQQIMAHLYCTHYHQAGFAYIHGIARKEPPSLTFEEFLEASKPYSTVILVDRESGVAFRETYQLEDSMDSFVVEVLSVSNPHMIKGRHILVALHHSIDLLIAILAYVCSQRDQVVEVETNKGTLRNGLKQLIDLRPKSKVEAEVKL
jgi:hypothetical protein